MEVCIVASDRETAKDEHPDQTGGGSPTSHYVRFGSMIVTAMVVMYLLTYTNTYEASHLRWSEQRLYMTLLMGASMAVVMLLFMLGMYQNWRINTAILVSSALLFGGAAFLIRSQSAIDDRNFLNAMIPHHSIAILASERADIGDLRVCELAVTIIEAQQREIREMSWLIRDIAENGSAETLAEARSRPVPDFEGHSLRACPG